MAISTSTVNILLASFRYNKTILLAFQVVCTFNHKEKSEHIFYKQMYLIVDSFVNGTRTPKKYHIALDKFNLLIKIDRVLQTAFTQEKHFQKKNSNR